VVTVVVLREMALPKGGGRQPAVSYAPGACASTPKLPNQVRPALRARHYGRRTEDAYAMWIRRFILFHGVRHSAAMGESVCQAMPSTSTKQCDSLVNVPTKRSGQRRLTRVLSRGSGVPEPERRSGQVLQQALHLTAIPLRSIAAGELGR